MKTSKPPKQRSSKTYSLELDDDLRNALEQRAEDQGVKIAVVVRWALRAYLFLPSSSIGATITSNGQNGEQQKAADCA